MCVAGTDEHLVLIKGEVPAHTESTAARVLRALAPVLPQQRSIPRVECLHDIARVGNVHYAVEHERFGLERSRLERRCPCQVQAADGAAIDLIERAVAGPRAVAAPCRPVRRRRGSQRLVGHERESGSLRGNDE